MIRRNHCIDFVQDVMKRIKALDDNSGKVKDTLSARLLNVTVKLFGVYRSFFTLSNLIKFASTTRKYWEILYVRLAAHVSNRCKSGIRPVVGRI